MLVLHPTLREVEEVLATLARMQPPKNRLNLLPKALSAQ